MQKLCHIDIEGKNGETKIFFSNFPFFLICRIIPSLQDGKIQFIYIQLPNQILLLRRGIWDFFRLFKVQNKEKLVWRETHTLRQNLNIYAIFVLLIFLQLNLECFIIAKKPWNNSELIQSFTHCLKITQNVAFEASGFQKLAKIDHLAFLMNFCPLKM